jgi:hypothetical protein
VGIVRQQHTIAVLKSRPRRCGNTHFRKHDADHQIFYAEGRQNGVKIGALEAVIFRFS